MSRRLILLFASLLQGAFIYSMGHEGRTSEEKVAWLQQTDVTEENEVYFKEVWQKLHDEAKEQKDYVLLGQVKTVHRMKIAPFENKNKPAKLPFRKPARQEKTENLRKNYFPNEQE